MTETTLAPGATVEPLVHKDRARAAMEQASLDALFGCDDDNLCYLSGHAPDSVLCHFYDDWAVAILPRHDAPACLVTSEYDIAYVATHRTWMPEVRFYGAEWSSASGLMKKIHAGEGVDTDLRPQLRELYDQTRALRAPGLLDAIVSYVKQHLPNGPLRLGFDDTRLGQAVADKIGERCTVVDARWIFRGIRLVKTQAEISMLRHAASVNEQALAAAGGAIRIGGNWSAMVDAFRQTLTRNAAKPAGERGMLFGAGPDGSFVLDHDYVAGKRFASGDAVVLDAISVWRLYYADMARTAVVGEPSSRQLRIFKAVREVLEEAEQKLRTGVHTRSIEELAAKSLASRGLEPRLATLVCHPIGLNVFDYGSREAVTGGWTLESDTVMNFEVFYRDPEAGGLHLEDSVCVRPDRIERLSTLSRELMILQ